MRSFQRYLISTIWTLRLDFTPKKLSKVNNGYIWDTSVARVP